MNSTSISVPLSHAQYRFLVEHPSAQKIVQEKLKAKGLDCEFDFDRREMLAEAVSSIDSTYVSEELGNIIKEHCLDVPPDHMDMLAAGVVNDVLTSWKSLSVNKAVIVNDRDTLKIVGLTESIDCLSEELKKTLDHVDAKAADMKKKKETARNCYVDVLPLSESCYEYLSRYKKDTVFGYGSRDVSINFVPPDENCPQGIEIAGPASDVQRVKERVREIVKHVKTTWFMLPGAVLSAYYEIIVSDIADKHNCIVRIGQSLTCDNVPGEVIKLKKNEAETSVIIEINELQLQMAEVIVNSTHRNLTLGVGRVSTALLKACGSRVQEELRHKYPNGIEHGEVAITGPGGLTCTAIYHGALPFWKGLEAVSMDQCYTELLLLVYHCLSTASASGYTSIAFPALGTGALEYPREEVVLLMYVAVRLFLEYFPDTPLKKICFVLYPWASRDLKQAFYAGSITQKVLTEQIEAKDVQEEILASKSENVEVLFRVGNILVKIVKADVKDACHFTSPLLVLWRDEEIQDPKRNKVLPSLCPSEEIIPKFSPKVREQLLLGRETILDETSVPTRTFIHCCCPSDEDKDVMTTVQQGLKRANQDKLDTVTLPILSGGVLAENPGTAANIVLKTVKKCSSCIFVVAVVIPDSHMFTEFVTEAAKIYKSEVPPKPYLIDLAESTWNTRHSRIAQLSQAQAQITAAFRMLPVEEDIMLTVTSDSDEKNKRIAHQIQKAVQK